MKILKTVLILLFCTTISYAQTNSQEIEEVVISTTKFKLKKEHVGKVVYKITQKDIAENLGKSLIDLLDNVAGVEINGNTSAKGSNLGLYFRGGRSRQVAVYIDGVLMSDPTGIATTYNLNLIDINQIESIEILKGAASTMYGTGAATGVINITLKKAKKNSFNLDYAISAGTNNTQRYRTSNFDEILQTFSVNGSLDKFTYNLNLGTSIVSGMSAASDKNATTAFEKDAFKSNNTMLKVGYNINKNINVTLFANYNDYKYDYDVDAYLDSNINNGFTKEWKHGLSADFTYNKGKLIFTTAANNLTRGFDSYNSWTTAVDNFEYKGTSFSAELTNKYTISDAFHVITGVNFQQHDNQTNTPYGNIDSNIANYETIDPYASIIYTGKSGFNVNVGARLNNHSEYGNHLVYQVNPSYNVLASDATKLKVLASYSTAFIVPSTYQLFSSFGNLNLTPEENMTAEVGFDASYKNWITLSSVFFYRDEDNKVIFNFDPITFVSQYVNSNQTTNTKGVETVVKLKPVDKIVLNLAYTYTHKNTDLNYIPKNKFTVNMVTQPLKNTTFTLGYKNLSSRSASYFDAITFSTVNTTLKSYHLIDASISYKLKNHVTLFGSLDNAFNEDYEAVYGYATRGRNFKVGMKLHF